MLANKHFERVAIHNSFPHEIPILALSLSFLSSCQKFGHYPDTCEKRDQLQADIFGLSDKLQSEFTEAGY